MQILELNARPSSVRASLYNINILEDLTLGGRMSDFQLGRPIDRRLLEGRQKEIEKDLGR